MIMFWLYLISDGASNTIIPTTCGVDLCQIFPYNPTLQRIIRYESEHG